MVKKIKDDGGNKTILMRCARTGEEKVFECVSEVMTKALAAGFRPIPGDRPPVGEDDPDKVTIVDD